MEELNGSFSEHRQKYQELSEESITQKVALTDFKERVEELEGAVETHRNALQVAVGLSEINPATVGAGLSAANAFVKSLDRVNVRTWNLSEIHGLTSKAPLQCGPSLVRVIAARDIKQMNVSGISQAMATADETILRRDLPMLFAALCMQVGRRQDSESTLHMLQAFQILFAHADSQLAKKLFHDVKEHLDLSSNLCAALFALLAYERTNLAAELCQIAEKRDSICSCDGVDIIYDVERVVVIKNKSSVGVVSPDSINILVDPTEGYAIGFHDAVVVGTWQTDRSHGRLDRLVACVRSLQQA